MQKTLPTTAIPVVEIGHERRTVLAALAALSVTLAIAITAATVTEGSIRPAPQDATATATPWVSPQQGPGSNSLSVTDATLTPRPWASPQHGPGSNSLSPAPPLG